MATLLIVDENQLDARLIQALVQRRAHVSVYAKNDSEAIRLLDENGPFHLVIATLSDAGSTQLILLDRIRSTPEHEDLPVVLCSERVQSVIVREAASLAVSGFILKPIRPNYLLDTIDRALSRSIPILRDHRQIQHELNLGLLGYQRLARRTVRDIEHALTGLSETDGALDGDVIASLESLRDALHSVGAYRALPPLDTALRILGDPTAAVGRPVIAGLATSLREVQAALLAAA